MLGEFEGVRILYCGNLGRRGQRILLEREMENLGADIVVSGIPNDGEPLMDPLLDAVRPGWILLTNSDYPANRRVRPETLERLKARGCRVSTSSESGMITLELSQGKFRVRSHKDSGEFVGGPSMGKLSRNSLKDRQEGLDK
jgi:beta-lactamase superfamily II metal-dependent hydrolase